VCGSSCNKGGGERAVQSALGWEKRSVLWASGPQPPLPTTAAATGSTGRSFAASHTCKWCGAAVQPPWLQSVTLLLWGAADFGAVRCGRECVRDCNSNRSSYSHPAVPCAAPAAGSSHSVIPLRARFSLVRVHVAAEPCSPPFPRCRALGRWPGMFACLPSQPAACICASPGRYACLGEVLALMSATLRSPGPHVSAGE
jgi:hypothetical protein